MRRNPGFTLIELMIVIALVAIIATVAVPSFQAIVESSRFKSSTNNVLGLLNYARSEAVRRGEPVAVQAKGASVQDGLNVVVLSAAANVPPNPLRTLEPMPGSVKLSLKSGDLPVFEGDGMKDRDDHDQSVFLICPGNGNSGAEIVVNAGGQTNRSSAAPTCS